MNTTETTIDWPAAEVLAAGLGIHTRRLVSERDAEVVRTWALTMAHEHSENSGNGPRVASYLELAAVVGHVEPDEELTDDTEPAE